MKRLLVVTYYFPPSGGAGVQRVLKWVKYLRDFDVEPVVLTVNAGAYPEVDETLGRDVPAGVEVHRTRSLDPFGVYARLTGRSRRGAVADATGRISSGGSWAERVARWARANVFLPDARIGWVPFAVREALRLTQASRFDAVLTSGPPHSAHLVGRVLHRRTGLPWIADFRDPWTDIHYNEALPRTPAARTLDEAMECSVLRHATVVTTVSPSLQRLLAAKVDRSPADIRIIYNGYDAEDFEAEPPEPDSLCFTLSYLGTLYGQPGALWQSLARLRERGEVDRLRVRLVGRMPPDTVHTLKAHGLSEEVEVVPYVSHDEAVQEMRRATALLLTIEAWPHSEIIMPGKMYEYLAAGRPIVGLGPTDGDAARLVRDLGAGQFFESTDVDGIGAYLLTLYAGWKEGKEASVTDSASVERFSRRTQAGELARLVCGIAHGGV